MRYCTRADLGNAIPLITLTQLSNDDPAARQPDENVIANSVRQAEEPVDGYLRGRYQLPLDPVPTVLRDAVLYLARHWLYQRRPEGALPDAVISARKDTLKLLESIRDGVITLGLPTGHAMPEPGEIRVRARPQQFTAQVWAGYP
ncbi:Mu-like prophage FluMu protein gp36 [Pseudomonas chlororaphis]|uniref:Mu-like prophage FluMu protein gp36 n=1 Tax=Pseudomonas chlororaphis TaxID=587753 RepID=A0A0A6D5S4_9PSED|nr:Mu-like prophage FluMu protein gp36 [Pseudomonas chlororaphis]